MQTLRNHSFRAATTPSSAEDRAIGMSHPEDFRDNCGFGLIANIKGKPSHELVETAIDSLSSMTHRGGIAADGKTGDGCGFMLAMPKAFFRTVLKEEQDIDLADVFAIGTVFLNQDEAVAAKTRDILDAELAREGLPVRTWRIVPTDRDVLGEIALKSLPRIEQIVLDKPADMDVSEFNRKLFLGRRRAEKIIRDQKVDDVFYVTTLCTEVVAYKGLMMPEVIEGFYRDLADPRLESHIAVFHQRFSTNTMPRWQLAQPFRYLAHNGEINTITANRNWSVARTPKFYNPTLPGLLELTPLVNRTGSDSSSLDNMLEILIAGGMNLFRALRMLVPPAWQNVESMDTNLRAFYEFNSKHMEAWDGPAGLVIQDGRYAVCMLDRNGLRPARWVITKNDFITLASEIGVWKYSPEDVVAKGRVGPGQILVIDTKTGDILDTKAVDNLLKNAYPYQEWLREHALRIQTDDEMEQVLLGTGLDGEELKAAQKMFNVTFEECDQIIRPLADTGQEAVGSMGDDTPMAVLSRQVRNVADYFRQQFAQVTNPPIDPLREAIVMSLETCFGREQDVFGETPDHANRVIISSPVLSPSKMKQLGEIKRPGYEMTTISLNYKEDEGLENAVKRICDEALKAVKDGKVILNLSDKNLREGYLPASAILATGAVHHHLIEHGVRTDCNIITETGLARDPHHFAVLLGFGATAVFPYLAYDTIYHMSEVGDLLGDPLYAQANFRKGIDKGLLKILSKMGISTIASYRGGQLFEAVGISREIIDLCFKGTPSRIEGATFKDIETAQSKLAYVAWQARRPLSQGGILKYVYDKEYHCFNPDIIGALHKAVRTGEYSDYEEYAHLVNSRPIATLRDLLHLRTENPVDISEVEPVEAIMKRFDSAGMSLGALSPEAHESIAVAMNTIGGRSNSGEGGEDPARYGTIANSKIKQVASGRFGVTPAYLCSAEVLQIKVAQGAKPGEGGQLPGGKVNGLIARLRYAVPGVTLISPPPHHDIYSIEDLAQLIYDLKQVNPQALVSVKLVSEPGVGTIAAGVAKAYADLITISGYDGGTAASPLSSIHYAGSPWELGLSEAQQALRVNDLRGKVRVQTDGGLKTGLDVVKAAILGAESFGFGSTPMIALGCKYLRICHLNNCATGVATQQEWLRKYHYVGKPEMLMNFFRLVAEETRQWLARLGVRSMAELIGRTDLLKIIEGYTDQQHHLDLRSLLEVHPAGEGKAQYCQEPRNVPHDRGDLAEEMVRDTLPAIDTMSGGTFSYVVTNRDRSIGARISGEIARRHGDLGMSGRPITLQLYGTAGQSLGVWNAGGLNIRLEGDSNDYVGKGMAGGQISIYPPKGSKFKTQETAIIGNTCLYGATGGQLFAAGTAGERFAVRNSGAFAVIEGAGDHCCEYMTGGLVVVLGRTGLNFGAGMTGGFAYVFDEANDFYDRCNHELIDLHRISTEATEEHRNHLKEVIKKYVAETDSSWAKEILADFDNLARRFWLVKPKAASLGSLLNQTIADPQ